MVTRSDSVNICHDWMSALENTHYGFKHHLKWLGAISDTASYFDRKIQQRI